MASLLLFVGGLWFSVGGFFALTGLVYSGATGFVFGLMAAATTCFLPGAILISLGALLWARYQTPEDVDPTGKINGARKRAAPRARRGVTPPWERRD